MQEFINMIMPEAEYILRIILAAFCGLLIGLERENRLKDAGMRTHLMVSLASALMMIVSKYGFFDMLSGAVYGDLVRLDPSRVAAGIVTGIGFIGAGTIFVRKQAVSGLTTAAGLWATVGVGMALGGGMYIIGVMATAIIVLWQFILHRSIKGMVPLYTKQLVVKTAEKAALAVIKSFLEKKGIETVSYKCVKGTSGLWEHLFTLKLTKRVDILTFAGELEALEEVDGIEI